MKINRLVILAALAALMAAAACQRETVVEEPEQELGPVFSAKLGQLTRSHFNDADEGTAKAGTLYWDATDRVAIVSAFQKDDETDFSERINSHLEELSEGVIPGYEHSGQYQYAYREVGYMGAYIGKPMTKYMAISSSLVDIQDDPTEALLHPELTGAQWFANANEAVGDPFYEFLAVYPMRGETIQPMTLLYWEGSMGCVGYPINIPRVQDGVQYGKYQICMDSGLVWDDSSPIGIAGLHYMSDVLSRRETIRFSHLNPISTLLRFRMRIADETTAAEVAKLVITMDDAEDELSGDSWVSAWGQECWIIPDRWTEGNNYKDVELDFSAPVSVSSTPTGYFYAVILPSFKSTGYAPTAANYYGDVDFRFDAYDSADNLLYTVTKKAPSTGFLPGGRYDFTLVLDGSVPDDGFELTVNAGGYQNGGNPFVQE